MYNIVMKLSCNSVFKISKPTILKKEIYPSALDQILYNLRYGGFTFVMEEFCGGII